MPGNLHLINGLYDAHRSGAPVLAIAAQIPSNEIGSNYFQETNPEHLFKDCSYFCDTVNTPDQLEQKISRATQAAINKKGVAVIVISGDVALEMMNHKIKTPIIHEELPVVPNINEITTAAKIINEAKNIPC